jgi:hypothetical protein
VEFTLFEGLQRLAHRVAVSEEERKALEATFLAAHGTDEEKKRLYTESESDKKTREDKEKFDAAVAQEVAKRQGAAAQEKAVQEAADAQTAQPVNAQQV